MCPDHQILSVYLDGELPSPWKEKMEGHLDRCPQCRQRLETYRLIPGVASGETALMEAARERVWRNLEARERFHQGGGVSVLRGASVWRRRISIPLPAVAAAAVLVIAIAALWVRRPVEQPAIIPHMALASDEALNGPDVVPIADMNGVLQYLGSKDSGDILILRLPESRNFMSSGEPAILKAADYTRRQP